MIKRLTDAELAAEYWRLRADHLGPLPVIESNTEINRKTRIIHRFATTPNAFEGAH